MLSGFLNPLPRWQLEQRAREDAEKMTAAFIRATEVNAELASVLRERSQVERDLVSAMRDLLQAIQRVKEP